jgi:hypothetical protein
MVNLGKTPLHFRAPKSVYTSKKNAYMSRRKVCVHKIINIDRKMRIHICGNTDSGSLEANLENYAW